jgi:hypothetical protein
MVKLGIFYGRLGKFKSIWTIFLPFDIFCGNLVCICIFPLWYVTSRKSGNPGHHQENDKFDSSCFDGQLLSPFLCAEGQQTLFNSLNTFSQSKTRMRID